MTPQLFGIDGKLIRLSNRIGKGGEGEVYALEGSNNVALKYYTVHDAHTREEKVRCMIAEQLASKSPLIAFPISIVFDKARKFAGFTMPRISGHQPLHELYSPAARKANFPQANFRFLVLTAANIARAIGMTHSNRCVVGDINHSGILISPKATVVLIDADSFQVSDGSKTYVCKVGVPEYTPPELQQRALGEIVRTPDHDAFGLAVVIFQLLFMGRHPFSGRYTGVGEMPLEKAIGENRFSYSLKRKVGMELPPGVPTLRDFPLAIAAAFESAFGPDERGNRPTAKHWMGILDELKDELKVCTVTSLHQYPASAPDCPWCRMEKRFAVPLFVPVLPTFDPTAAFPQMLGDVLTIWRAIEAVRPPVDKPYPEFAGPTPSPSAKAAQSGNVKTVKKVVGWGAIVGAALLLFTQTANFFVAAMIAGAGYFVLKRKIDGDEEAIQYFKGTQTRLYQSQAEWAQKNSGVEFQELKQSLKAKKAAYEGLQQEQTRKLEDYQKNRRAVQLKLYLDGILIRSFKIPKIGPGRQAVLMSYGIETAGDVTDAAVMRVPGFGPKTAQPLLNWRRHMEGRFVYSTAPSPADQAATNAIKAEIARKAAELKTELSKGPAQLQQLSAAITARQSASLPFAQTILAQHAQAVADMRELGLKFPDVPKPALRPAPSGTSMPSSATTTSATPAASVRCPKCGGNMVIRLAMRGRHRGNKFYGCVRYPACNGTRSFP